MSNASGDVAGLARPGPSAAPGQHGLIETIDDALPQALQQSIYAGLRNGGWTYGWKSNAATDAYAFWHWHFAGTVKPDHHKTDGTAQPYDCAAELERQSPRVYTVWRHLQQHALAGHTLVRCYANAFPYGCDGTLHTDSLSATSFTSVYYPHDEWHPNWGGETVFFNDTSDEIVASIYPRPNRLVCFPGTIPHVARGLTRSCPAMRITLMFKTERCWPS